jgi:hypothetical protein
MMLDDLTDALKRRIYLMARDMIDQTLADEAQLAQYIGEKLHMLRLKYNVFVATFTFWLCHAITVRNEICEFILDNNDKSNEQGLEWLNSWGTRIAKEVPLDEYKCIGRALCQYFALQYAKLCLFSKPDGLTGFSFSKEVSVYLSARDDFDILVHLTYEWEAGQLFYSALQLAQEEAEYIDSGLSSHGRDS